MSNWWYDNYADAIIVCRDIKDMPLTEVLSATLIYEKIDGEMILHYHPILYGANSRITMKRAVQFALEGKLPWECFTPAEIVKWR